GPHGVRAELHDVSRAPGPVRDRDGRRVGRGRVPGHGEGATPVSGRRVGFLATGVRAGLPARRPVLPRPVPALRLAAAVLHRWPARAARAVRAGARAGVGGVAGETARGLEWARARDPGPPPDARVTPGAHVAD